MTLNNSYKQRNTVPSRPRLPDRADDYKRPVIIVKALPLDVQEISDHMRPSDWSEIRCVIPEGWSRRDVGREILSAANGLQYVARYKGRPVAFFGFLRSHQDNLWSAFAYGTHKIVRAMPEISRYCEQVLQPTLVDCGATRVEVRVKQAHIQSVRWLKKMGARTDCEMKFYGRNGETFMLMSWDLDSLPDRYGLDGGATVLTKTQKFG